MKYTSLIITVLLTFATATATATAQTQSGIRDTIEKVLYNNPDDDLTRYRNAHNLLTTSGAPAEDTEKLGLDLLYPFVMETWEGDAQQRHINLSKIYLLIAYAYRERNGEDGNEKELFYMREALSEALLSEDEMQCATCYNYSAFVEIKRGTVAKAHEYLYEAIHYYDRLGMYVKSSEMLYTIAGNFAEMKDARGLERVLEQMREYLKKDNSKQSAYQYNAIKHDYFELLEEQSVRQNGRVDYSLVDSAMVYINANIALVEKSLPELAKNWIHGYAYYYLARELDTYYPEQTGRILKALDRAREIMQRELAVDNPVITVESNLIKEFDIMLNSIRAGTLFRMGNLWESRAILDRTLVLLGELDDHENLNTVRSTIYRFAVEYYKKAGNPNEALHFQTRLTANEERIHEREKITAINDMSAKYDAERNRIRIDMLTRENHTTRQIMWLIAGLSLALIAAGGSIVISERLRRRSIEQQLYETALVAELSALVPIRETIEKILSLISGSNIEQDSKAIYRERLDNLDISFLENIYRSSEGNLTSLDMKYIVCFVAKISVRDISILFNVEQASVNTVRYRIRKKIAQNDPTRLII